MGNDTRVKYREGDAPESMALRVFEQSGDRFFTKREDRLPQNRSGYPFETAASVIIYTDERVYFSNPRAWPR